MQRMRQSKRHGTWRSRICKCKFRVFGYVCARTERLSLSRLEATTKKNKKKRGQGGRRNSLNIPQRSLTLLKRKQRRKKGKKICASVKPGLVYWVMETAIIVAATAAAADTESTEPDDGEHTVAHVRGVHVPDEADKRAAYWLTRALM